MMNSTRTLGPFCQSCSMPMTTPEDFGTDAAGYHINDYCRHCYQNGSFTEPDLTLAEVLESGVGEMTRQGIMPEMQARALLNGVLPGLKRWRDAKPHPEATAGAARQGRGLGAGDDEC